MAAWLAVGTPAHGQGPREDLQQPLPVVATPYDRSVEAAKQAMMSDPGDALRQARRAGRLADDMPGKAGAIQDAMAAWLEGEALTRLNHPERAAPILTKALASIQKIDPGSKLHADLLKSVAAVEGLNGDVAAAMQQLHRAHAIYRKLGDARSQSIVLLNIGSIYSDANDHRQALRYYALAQEAYSQDPMMTLAANNNRGTSYKALGRYEDAVGAYRAALRAAEATGSTLLEARILTNIASAQYLGGQLAQADATLAKGFALATGEAADWRPFIWGVKAQIAHARGRDLEARTLLERTFAGQDPAETTLLFRDFHETAYKVYSALGQFDRAVRHLATLKRLDDEARETAASTNFALMNARFDAQTQELRLEQSRNELSRVKHLSLAGGIALLIVILAILYGLLAAKRSRREVDAANRRLTYAARHDALTGLPNRLHARQVMTDALDRSAGEAAQCGLLLIDLDKFKSVNDTFGHAGGDRLLELASQRLVELAGEAALPARLGGDEFAMVVPRAATPATLEALARQVVRALAEPFEIFGSSVIIGGSIGFAMSPGDGSTVDELVRNADLALYEAKRRGRGQACQYAGWMTRTADEAEQLEQALRSALTEGELRLAFQPIVCANTGKVRAREALLRWRHPRRGEMSPAEFVALAESSGLIEPIGAWVLQQACRTATTWEDGARVAVNVSVAQLKNAGFVATVVNALSASGLDPQRLELEITESLFLYGEELAVETLVSLRNLGVTLSLDDFGTGYSSLSYLQRGVFSHLKIDQSFVHRLAHGDADCHAIVRGIVDLARNFEMETVAEGVESEVHSRLMTELGCTYLQGYYIGQPEEAGSSPVREVFDATHGEQAA